MHSGADVDAFQAALNRDIGGDVSTSQPSDSESGMNSPYLYNIYIFLIFSCFYFAILSVFYVKNKKERDRLRCEIESLWSQKCHDFGSNSWQELASSIIF